MSQRDKRITWVSLSLCLAVVGSCSVLAPRPDPTRFYVLATLADLGVVHERGPRNDVTLGVGPVRFPAYLGRGQLATRVAPSRVEYSEQARWAESPETDFTRTLASNLAMLLQTDSVLVYPWFKMPPFDYVVGVDVIRFEATADGGAVLKVLWAVKDGETQAYLHVRESDIREEATSAGAEASVEALSRALGTLSRQVAREIEALGATAPNAGS